MNQKRTLCSLISLIMIVSLVLPIVPDVVRASSPTEIWDWYDLAAVSNNLSGSYVLMRDLNSSTSGYDELAGPAANDGKGWEPIGTSGNRFSGTFDGQGNEIRDLFVSRPNEDFVGLFGCLARGIIENVDVVNLNVTGRDSVGGLVGYNFVGCVSAVHSDGSVTGVGNVGGLVGYNIGSPYTSVDGVSDSHSSGSVTGVRQVGGLVGYSVDYGLVTNSYTDSSVTGGTYVGGLVGLNSHYARVHYSYSAGNVDGSSDVGGLVGRNNRSFVADSYSSGGVTGNDRIGGLVGDNIGSVRNSHSVGRVTGDITVGGLVGLNGWSLYERGSVANSYSIGSVTGTANVGGLVGHNYRGSTVSNSHYNYDDVLINGENVITIGALFDQDFEEWLANDRFLDVDERLFQEDGYHVINNINDLKQLLAFGQNGSLRFRLTDDLDLFASPNFHIPYLAGEFAGDGYRIENLTLDSDFVLGVGLFGHLVSGAEVNELGVENVNVTGNSRVGGLVGYTYQGRVLNSYSTGTVTGYSHAGGLVGESYEGTVLDSHSAGTVSGELRVGGLIGASDLGTVDNSYSTVSVYGQRYVGGLVGENWHGTVRRSHSAGSVSGYDYVGGLIGHHCWRNVLDSYSTGSVSGYEYIGGLVGYMYSASVHYSYSTGSVSGDKYVGGLVGLRRYGSVGNSFWDIETSERTTSPYGGTGKTTAEMMDISTFTDTATEGLDIPWDIIGVRSGETNPAYIWNVVDGDTYPFLSWQLDSDDGDQVVAFPDKSLEEAIREAVNKPEGDIYQSDLESLTGLDATYRKISDLTGLEYAINLKRLNLGGNEISDISPLASLSSLTDLWLWGNYIEDLWPLAELSNLEYVFLQYNMISEIAPLATLTGLTVLVLKGNSVRDISPLVENVGLAEGDSVDVVDNPLSIKSYHSHIPELEARGVTVLYDDYTPTQRIAYIPVKYRGEADPEPAQAFHEFNTWSEWFVGTAQLVSAYFYQQSYGCEYVAYDVVFHTWEELPGTRDQYPDSKGWRLYQKFDEPQNTIVHDAIAMAEERLGFDPRGYYDAVLVIHADVQSQAPIGDGVAIADVYCFGTWVHELGHALPDFSWQDYYGGYTLKTRGEIGYWGLMGYGDVTNPPAPVMSYNKEKAGWLEYETVSYGTYEVKLLKDLELGDSVLRWDTPYIYVGGYGSYIFEGRHPSDDVIVDERRRDQIMLTEEEGILVYGIKPPLFHTTPLVYTIPHKDANHYKVTLTDGDSYEDHLNRVAFTANKEGSQWYITVSERPLFGRSVFSLRGSSMEMEWEGHVSDCGQPLENPFDIDLRVFSADGRMVGMDYDTGEYVIEIEDAVTSGNILGGGPEWISVPDNEKVYFAIDPTPARKWAEELGIDTLSVETRVQAFFFDDQGERTETEPLMVPVHLDEVTYFALEDGEIRLLVSVDLDPNTLNLRARGGVVTAYIELPEGFDVGQIDVSTILLNGTVPALSWPTSVGDYNNNGIPDLMVKFDRRAVQEVVEVGESVEITITGEVDGIPFSGTDAIRVIGR